MNYALLKSAAIGVAVALSASYSAASPFARYTSSSGCLIFSKIDSATALNDVKLLVSDGRFHRARANPGFPSASADSVSFYTNPIACDTAANRFRLARIAAGEADTLWPVLLMRIGPSNKLVATSAMRQSRDYVLFDSLLNYMGEFNIR